MAKIIGIGGVFFRSRGDSVALTAWDQKHLGLSLEDFGGAIVKWTGDKAEDQCLTVWHVPEKEGGYFDLPNWWRAAQRKDGVVSAICSA